ncbi:WD40-repeat-containing domain protein [Nemania sp. FL0031]|nr:WD40-repeat-containing domain protein [Nemania sp. FL0031]
MKEYLDSDRVNFLIWRYLLEGNYRETAVKFQKEWHIEAPHRQLDFAPYVKSHALVNVLNKGLLYHSLEREHAQTIQVPGDAAQAALAEAMQLGVFGPLVAHPLPHQQQAEESDDDAEAEPDIDVQPPAALIPAPAPPVVSSGVDVENSRKRQGDRQQQALVNGSPAKRPRLSNGYEHGADAATTPMELDGPDHQGDNHAYPSPLEGEQASTPVPRTDGPEQGTQIDKVVELASETTFIPLGSGLDNDASALSPVPALSRVNGDSAPVLLHCQWHPQDPSLLAAAGTDALARIWNISRGAAADPASDDHVNSTDLVEKDIPRKTTITSMAWNFDGTAIAIATDPTDPKNPNDTKSKARVTLWTPDGSYIQHVELGRPPIIKLHWSPHNTAILAIAPDEEGGTLITICHAHSPNTITYSLKSHDLQSEPLDAAWTNDTEFLLCGGKLLALLRYTDKEIIQVQKFETREEDTLTQVQYDARCSMAATCGYKGIIDIWENTGKRRSINAHCDAVTALAWQPRQSSDTDNERLLASGGEDGAIFIWNALANDGAAKCSMTMGPAIVALAFTPDGAFLAGATNERILIWKVGDHGIPRASWSRLPHPGWVSPRLDSESYEEDEHCLSWDATGHKLAYGVNSRLAIINFR